MPIRRPVLALALCVSIAAPVTPAHAQAPGPAPRPATPPARAVADSLALVPLARGVFAFVAPTSRGGLVNGNTLVVVGDSAVLVFDTGHFPALARRMIGEIRRLTPKPVRWIVNSHWHPDHWVGNAELLAAWPDATILATAETREQMLAQGPTFLQQYRDTPAIARQFRAILERGTGGDGKPLSAGNRAYMQVTAEQADANAGAWADARLVAPTRTFAREETVDLGARTVRVLAPGRGNTAGDAVVFVPDARVLATGDLVVAPSPFAFGSFIGEWIAVLDSLKALAPAVIVPGHGDVQRDAGYVSLVGDVLREVRAQVGDAVRRGLTLPQTYEAVDLAPLRARFGHDESERALFDIQFVTPAVERAYREMKGDSGR